ncbi:hypothetical protein [Phenylobacterium sp.]|jgi:hypothetical protein|uniref:hypothetical protein n=1 Tax=Phenylobacterium sp. TaxID=1871053 RepID=UPI002F91EBD4
MATLSYTDQSTPYADAHAPAAHHDTGYGRAHRDLGATAFVWLAWAAAAFFWGMTLTTAFNIMGVAPPAQALGPGEADAGGVGWGLINFVGVIVLGLAIAYGAMRYFTRDKRKDPVTEAATASLYDRVERSGGDDEVTLSPEAHETGERAAYRDVTLDRDPLRP